MSDDGAGTEVSLVAQALEHPRDRYTDWAARPEVARALEDFRSERDIRKTERLDLVTWVQYICAFGYAGPTDDAWAALFAACRVLPMLGGGNGDDILREHEIAVMLAFAKITPDHRDTMTTPQLIKHRIRPAVLGRTVARTPGILQHIRVKFENWALGPFTDLFCSNCVSLFGPSSYMPGADDLPPQHVDMGDSIRQCADAHATRLLKTWMSIVSTVLDLEENSHSPRAMRFETKLHEKRKYMYHHIFVKIFEEWCNRTKNRACVPEDRDTLVYRDNPYAVPSSGERLFAKGSPDSELLRCMKKFISLSPIYQPLPAWSEFSTHITICELHKPSIYGLAALEFVSPDAVQKNVVRLLSPEQCSSFTASQTSVRIGSHDSDTLMATVRGVPPSQMCRALKVELKVNVLPPKSGSSRPKFRVTELVKASWVALCAADDKCVEREPISEMGMEADEEDDEDATDPLHKWFCSSGIGSHFASGAGCHWETSDLCEGMSKHVMKITVPEEILKVIRTQGRVSEQIPYPYMAGLRTHAWRHRREQVKIAESTTGSCSSIDMDVESSTGSGAETFLEPCWIDCHTGVRLTYASPPGIELYAASPEKVGIFKNLPYWKSRAP